MNPLQFELDRLYGLDTSSAGTRALVLELTQPAGWTQLSAVWKGVQSDLDLPAPAIAVSGDDALQLWFSLAAPVAADVGERFLHGLHDRYLSELSATLLRLLADSAVLPPAPPVQTGPDRWSAFVAPDLAAVFADTPWLDVAPNSDGQAALLRALEPMQPAAFDAACRQLGVLDQEAPRANLAPTPSPGMPPGGHGAAGEPDAMRFLKSVMNDVTAPLALRIEAAKALLPYADPREARR
jgi:hypothetical protein